MTDGERDLPQFADYRVLERIGAGGMGEVFLAQRRGAGELSVIKRLRPEVLEIPEIRARFLREAEVCSLLSHPNIARLLDARVEDGEMFLAFEHIAGRDLEAIAKVRMRAGMSPMPVPLVVELGLAVLAGLGSAHEQTDASGAPLHIVHRDIGLRNLMISYSGEVKIIDFGLVRASLGDLRTRTGALMGTPRFMSPEQATGERVDQRGDLYSVGVVLFELFSGRVFIKGQQPIEILRGILETPVPKISELEPELPAAFDAFFERALFKVPERRFQTAKEMSAALREAAKSIARPPDPRDAMASMMAPLFVTDRARLEQAFDEAKSGEAIAPATKVAPAPRTPTPVPEPTRTDALLRSSSPTSPPQRSLLPIGAAFLALAAAVAVGTFAMLRPEDSVQLIAEPPVLVAPVTAAPVNAAPKIAQRPVQEISEPPAVEQKMEPEVKVETRPKAKIDPRPEPVLRTAPLQVAEPPVKAPVLSFGDIRTLLSNGDARSLVDAETKIRAASETLAVRERVAISDCLTGATTAPNATVWRQGLDVCFERLVRAHREQTR